LLSWAQRRSGPVIEWDPAFGVRRKLNCRSRAVSIDIRSIIRMQAADLMPSCLPFDILADDAPVIGETMVIRRGNLDEFANSPFETSSPSYD
jgi:hypothetical protein